MNEINARIVVIDAIQKLCSDPQTDELHVFHPLISQALWLFDIEYDNPNYTFNRRLSTVMIELLDVEVKEDTTINYPSVSVPQSHRSTCDHTDLYLMRIKNRKRSK